MIIRYCKDSEMSEICSVPTGRDTVSTQITASAVRGGKGIMRVEKQRKV